ncbi:hypothetical protein LJC48_02385 [Desulfovibrio sp. OttesenSCG-928-C06]|nr:hypothetical protein [Desulfovibrio sp. OttesenSCG-928-C06]
MPNIFSQPGKAAGQKLQLAAQAIDRAFPLKRKHYAELHYAVRDLSRLLTTERGQKQAYWSSPRFLSAYLRYFLPWNLLRLSRLLPALPLDLPAGGRVLDLGSGPLTVPLALWLSRRDLRMLDLRIVCSDTAPRPMELGRDIYRLLVSDNGETESVPGAKSREKAAQATGQADGTEAGAASESRESVDAPRNAGASSARGAHDARETGARAKLPWHIVLARDPLELAIRKTKEKVHLITAANVLNELPTPRQESLEEKLGSIFASMHRILEPGGQILLIEPGTRLGGKLVALMRRLALEKGYTVLAPCTHQEACPFLTERDEDADEDGADDDFMGSAPSRKGMAERNAKQAWQPRPSGWCHFSHDAEGAWPELLRLSAAADLPKERLSLSFVLLRKPLPGENSAAGRKTDARAAKSAPFASSGQSVRTGQTGEFAKSAQPAKNGRTIADGRQSSLPAPGEYMDARVISDIIKVPGKGICRYVCTRAGLGLLRDAAELDSGAEVGVTRHKNGGIDPKTGALDLV